MNNDSTIKELVREKYAAIASQPKSENASSCCGATGCCGDESTLLMADEYSALPGYNPDADLGLGCGLPTEFANIREGDTVIDLGSGAGNDIFVARKLAGEKGKLIGIDCTSQMVEKARVNAENLGLQNVNDVRIGKHINLQIEASSKEEAASIAEDAAKKLLSNPVMEEYSVQII